jgi:Ca-activated chloride channel homolog
MLNQIHPGLYNLSIGNIKVTEKVEVTIKYIQKLQFIDDEIRIRIPTTFAPRYGDPRDGGLKDHETPLVSALNVRSTSFTGEFYGVFANAKITSPSHSISVINKEDSSTFHLCDEKVVMDRDFIIKLIPSERKQCVAKLVEEEKSYMVYSRFQPYIENKENSPLNIHIVLDCSGSMAGVAIEQSRDSLMQILNILGDKDKVNLTLFGSNYKTFSEYPLRASRDNLAPLFNLVANLQADMGGTEMLAALESVFKSHRKMEESFDVMLITDGAVFENESLLRLAKNHRGRVFTVGVGHSAGEIVEELAEVSGGACELITPDEGMVDKIERHCRRMRTKRIPGARIEWPSKLSRQEPEKIKTLYSGDTIHVFGYFDKKPEGEVALAWENDAGISSGLVTEIPVISVCAKSDDIHPLSQLAAFETINRTKFELEKAALSERYGIVSECASMILVHEREELEKATALPELHQVEHMISSGSHGIGAMHSIGFASGPVEDIPAFLRRSSPGSGALFQTRSRDTSRSSKGRYYKIKSRIHPSLKVAKIIITKWLQELENQNISLSGLELDDLAGIPFKGLSDELMNILIDIATRDRHRDENALVISFLRLVLDSNEEFEVSRQIKRKIRYQYRKNSNCPDYLEKLERAVEKLEKKPFQDSEISHTRKLFGNQST